MTTMFGKELDSQELKIVAAQFDQFSAQLANVPILLQTDGPTALFVLGLLLKYGEIPELARWLFDPDDPLGRFVNSLSEQVTITPELTEFVETMRKGTLWIALQNRKRELAQAKAQPPKPKPVRKH